MGKVGRKMKDKGRVVDRITGRPKRYVLVEQLGGFLTTFSPINWISSTKFWCRSSGMRCIFICTICYHLQMKYVGQKTQSIPIFHLLIYHKVEYVFLALLYKIRKKMEQSKKNKKSCTGPKIFEICFCVILDRYCEKLISVDGTGH